MVFRRCPSSGCASSCNSLQSVSSASVETSEIELDTGAPYLEAVAPWAIFSLDGNSSQDRLPISISKCTDEKLWTASVIDGSGKTVKTYTWNGKVRTDGKDEFAWDGSDESGNKVADGKYTVVIASTDNAPRNHWIVHNRLILNV